MTLSLCSMAELLVVDEGDLLLGLDLVRLVSEVHAVPPGGVRQADRNAACGVFTLCSSAEASR